MSVPRTAFVLSGGASLGALQAGMLRALYERGITADLLVGTSAGALNAAFIASRPQTVRTARALGRVWCDLQRDGGRRRTRRASAARRRARRHLDFAPSALALGVLYTVDPGCFLVARGARVEPR
jgi:predicted acylesterase/phospholipase RssA